MQSTTIVFVSYSGYLGHGPGDESSMGPFGLMRSWEQDARVLVQRPMYRAAQKSETLYEGSHFFAPPCISHCTFIEPRSGAQERNYFGSFGVLSVQMTSNKSCAKTYLGDLTWKTNRWPVLLKVSSTSLGHRTKNYMFSIWLECPSWMTSSDLIRNNYLIYKLINTFIILNRSNSSTEATISTNILTISRLAVQS